MRKRVVHGIVAAIAAIGLLAGQALGQGPAVPLIPQDPILDAMNLCLCRTILARVLCKKTNELNFVAKADPTGYWISAFWGNKDLRFYCGVDPGSVRIQAKGLQQFTRTIPVPFDPSSRCATVDYSNPECPTSRKVACCLPKTEQEKQEESFWNRPVLDLLKQDLERAQNATAPAAAPAAPATPAPAAPPAPAVPIPPSAQAPAAAPAK